MKVQQIDISTTRHSQMLDISYEVQKIVAESGVKEGICLIYSPHTTAKIVPWEDKYRHFEGNSAAHIKASMMGFSQEVIIEDGRLLLGTWQGIYFCEYDGPRRRKVYVKILEG